MIIDGRRLCVNSALSSGGVVRPQHFGVGISPRQHDTRTNRCGDKAAEIIAILSGILLPLSVVVGYPPFVFGFLWLAIGIGLLRRK